MPRLLMALPMMLLLLSNTSASEPLNAAMLALPCTGCHGSFGKSQTDIPSLESLSREQLYQAMHAFKSGKRHATVMNRIAKAYSDTELQAIANYFGKHK